MTGTIGTSKTGAEESPSPAGFPQRGSPLPRLCGEKRSVERSLEIAGIHFRRFESDHGIRRSGGANWRDSRNYVRSFGYQDK